MSKFRLGPYCKTNHSQLTCCSQGSAQVTEGGGDPREVVVTRGRRWRAPATRGGSGGRRRPADPREAVEGGGGSPRRRRLGETKRDALREAQTETNGGAAQLELVRGWRRLGQALERRRCWTSSGGA